MTCVKCHREIKGKPILGMCQGCYMYFRNGGRIHPLPPKGVIQKDENGYVICHICGRSYKRLGSHIKESHNMTIAEYKEQFGICTRTKTTEDSYSKTMKKHALDNDMDKQLLDKGKNTRIKKGDKSMRLGKEVRLQERIQKRTRNNLIGNI